MCAGPAGLTGNKAQFILQGKAVDLVDHPVNFKRQRLADGFHPVVKFSKGLPAFNHSALACHRKPPLLKAIQRAAVR